MTENREVYDVRSASRRVRRARRTIYRWMREGMPYRVVDGRRFIAHADLLATHRLKNDARMQHARRHDQRGRFHPAQEIFAE